MQQMIFLWSPRNEEHIGIHDVAPEEAEYVVGHTEPPFPRSAGGEKLVAWGKTRHGRFLQVVFVHVSVEDVETDEYERLKLHERLALDAGEPASRIIHARDLVESEKKRLRRWRGRA